MKTTASLGAYEAAPEVIERRLLTLAQSLDRYQVSAGHGGEHQMSFLAAYPVAWEDFSPHTRLIVSSLVGFRVTLRFAPEGLLFHVQQALQFIGENHVYEFVKSSLTASVRMYGLAGVPTPGRAHRSNRDAWTPPSLDKMPLERQDVCAVAAAYCHPHP